MRVCLFSKYGKSSNLLYEGTRQGLSAGNHEFLDLNVSEELGITPPHWVAIPTLSKQPPTPAGDALLARITEFRPDLLLVLQYDGLQFLLDYGEQLRELLPAGRSIGFWLVDLEEEIYENKTLGSYIDYLFLSNAGQLDDYRNRWGLNAAEFMPQGCMLAPQPPTPTPPSRSIGFLGRRQRQDRRYDTRNQILDSLAARFTLVEPTEVQDIAATEAFYHDTDIIVGASWRNDVELYSSDRIYNVLGAGGFYLCAHFPGIDRLFRNRTHLAWFTNEQEALELAGYYLEHHEERNRIATAGYNLVKDRDTYERRVDNVVRIIAGTSPGFEGYL